MVTVERGQRRGDAATLRRIWRLHFWVGLFAAPTLLLLACTGLIILYTQPLNLLLHRDLTVVSQPNPASTGASPVSLDTQVDAARQQVPADMILDAVTPPEAPDRSTQIDFMAPETADIGERNVTQVFVDPYTGNYLGQRRELDGLVGWANQLHRFFGNDGPTVSVPALGHFIAPSSYPDASMKVGVGNLIVEMTAVWILVLLASGIFLWWPRATERGKPRLAIRWRKGGRVRWRDLHATTGILLSVVLIGYIVSGLTWSRYWGENWRAVASTVTPSTEVDAPSTPAKVGDFDRLGRRIAWADTDDPVYASDPGPGVPMTLGFNEIDEIAKSENMLPGFSIVPPSDYPGSTADDETVYGSYTVVNHWPHGVLTRILATLACLGLLTSITTAMLMWWKRRPTGGTGLPGRTSDAQRGDTPRGAVAAIAVIATALAVLYPSFGVTLIVVLVAEGILSAVRGRGSAVGADSGG